MQRSLAFLLVFISGAVVGALLALLVGVVALPIEEPWEKEGAVPATKYVDTDAGEVKVFYPLKSSSPSN